MELLVVIALTIILMGLLLGPLGRTFGLLSQGRAKIDAQDNVRFALQRMSRDVQDAMLIITDQPINLWHYSKYEPGDRPSPTADAVPVAEPTVGAMVDLVMPRMRFFCTNPSNPHYLLDTEVPPNAAIDSCPRPEHEGSPVERRPLEPLQPEGNVIRYFIGLKHPMNPRPDAADPTSVLNQPLPGAPSDLPHYLNGYLFPNTAGSFDNIYVLYRVEFNPNDPSVSNWRLPDGRSNPNFFYDPGKAPGTDHTFADEWKARTVAIITAEDTDMIRLISAEGGGFRPDTLLRVAASPVENEALEPAKTLGVRLAQAAESQPDSSGAGQPMPLFEGSAPAQYVADYDYWSGPENDMTRPLLPAQIMGSVPPVIPELVANFASGPRIQVYERRPLPVGGEQLALVYDSGVSALEVPRQRLLSWDSRRGVVNFALRRTTTTINAGDPDPTSYRALVDNLFSVDLKKDTAVAVQGGAPLPGGLGAVKQVPQLAATASIVPGTEEITRSLDGSDTRVVRMQRAGYTGLGNSADKIVAQADLQPNEYMIDYQTGVIQFSDRDSGLIGQPVRVRYQWQTNRPTDLVRVSYATRQLMTISLGVQQYDQRTGSPEGLQLSTRVRVRNLER